MTNLSKMAETNNLLWDTAAVIALSGVASLIALPVATKLLLDGVMCVAMVAGFYASTKMFWYMAKYLKELESPVIKSREK